ncbi:MAG: nucleotidyltransferase domain-containing protein [Candidatus Scalindua sp.]|nr:nucleotidyltransferase domain-containing protein [Candidatus Scalindua sp.]
MKLYTIKERKRALKAEYKRILDIIVRECKPEKVVLFGSFADGEIHEWSDIDMLIIKETSLRPIERPVELSRLVAPKLGIDFFIYTPDEYKNLLSENYSFLVNIIKKGKVVYEKRS